MIRAEHLTVCYGAQCAVRDVSLNVPRGSVTAVVGPSGCGKSSFLWSLNRMADMHARARISGKVLLDDVDVRSSYCRIEDLRRRVGLIFQNPAPFPLSIRRNIELGLIERGIHDRTRLEEITERVLEDVGLLDEVKDRIDLPAQNLSGGQQQRLCIARHLALEPDVLLMDEPCSALDPIAAKVVEELIARLRGRYTIVIVTHNLAQARRIADEAAVFWLCDGSGTLIEHGSAEQVFNRPANPVTAQ